MNDLPLLQIVNWDETFERTKSRTVDKCAWVCVPSKHDGTGLMMVLGKPDGAALYGIWMLLVQLCVRQPKPRAGWLTHNGRRDGRRFTLELLTHKFRRPKAEIQRMIATACEPDIEWIKVVEGNLAAFGIPVDGDSPSECQPASHQDGHEPATEVLVTHGENEVLPPKCLPTDHLGGPIREGKGRESLSTSDPIASGGKQSDPILHAEAKRLFGQLSVDAFGEPLRENQWPSDMEHWLDAALPMNRAAWDLIAWFYRVPADHEILKVTRRRQSMRTLVEHLQSEPQKIRSARKSIGLNGLHDDDPAAVPANDRADGGWTQARKEAAFALFGEAVSFATSFDKIPGDFQRKIDTACAEEKTKK